MAEALTARGLQATLLEQLDQIMPTLDAELAAPLASTTLMSSTARKTKPSASPVLRLR